MNPNYCIETQNLVKTFDNKYAINDLTLAIPTGGIHAIVGSNGAGKSTLFRMLLGVETPSSGGASVFGEDCLNLAPASRARIGYVNEEHTLPAWMAVDALIQMQKHFYPKWDDTTYQNVVGFFDVDEKQKVGGLSRGERAGLNLAMALAQQSEVLILDEPTLGLDVVAKQSFLEALLFTERATESTIIYCSHQMEEIERVADNLIVLEKGRLTNNSSPEAFVERISGVFVDLSDASTTSSTTPTIKPHELLTKLQGLLKVKRMDDMHELTFIDQSQTSIQAQLNGIGLSQMTPKNISLNEAVNAFLSQHHSRPNVQ